MRSESQTFRRAIDESKVKLHLAVSPDTWLMPSNLLLNTQSTVGYNKSLKKTNKDRAGSKKINEFGDETSRSKAYKWRLIKDQKANLSAFGPAAYASPFK